jgi:uncharacterized protein YbjQ (UPF0145 family)
MYCLAQKGYKAGNIVVGNSVYSLGIVRGISTGFKSILGGELQHITELIEEGREKAYKRLEQEAAALGATGVTSELIFHSNNIEFLSIGSAVHAEDLNKTVQFTTSANGQELFCQLDVGYKPMCFTFGNVAYSMGVGRGIMGSLKTFQRGEIKEYSDMFNETRHLALKRILAHAFDRKANAVLGIKTTILPFVGTNEMLMVGTASRHPDIDVRDASEVISSDLTNVEIPLCQPSL